MTPPPADHVRAAVEYVRRCRNAGDTRDAFLLLEEIVDGDLAAELAYLIEVPWA